MDNVTTYLVNSCIYSPNVHQHFKIVGSGKQYRDVKIICCRDDELPDTSNVKFTYEPPLDIPEKRDSTRD